MVENGSSENKSLFLLFARSKPLVDLKKNSSADDSFAYWKLISKFSAF